MSGTKHIAIIGGGFCGIITAVNLLKGAKGPLKITLINSGAPLVRGIAYNTYSSTHLLNVTAGNMSAFPDDMENFTNWLSKKSEYITYQKDLLAKTFMPRNLYGEYLCDIWNTTLAAKRKDIDIHIIDDYVVDMEFPEHELVNIFLKKGTSFTADYVVLATGNSLPQNPILASGETYYSSSTYFRNPWSIDSVSNLKPEGDVLIIGNGLTMVDMVIGLMEHGFKNKIYSVSTNGFGILPHRNFGVSYNELAEELKNPYDLHRLVSLFNKHIKKIRRLGISAGPVIDSIRPYSQKIWQLFTLEEKKKFLSKFRHIWGVARHRLPVLIFDMIERLRINGQLEVYKGKLLDITEKENRVMVTFYNAKKHCNETLFVQRVINCTGPETNIYKTTNPLLRKLAEKKTISSDPLQLGINTDISTYRIINIEGKKNLHFFTLGSNLKGMLWETIAVPELRVQCKQLAEALLKSCEKDS